MRLDFSSAGFIGFAKLLVVPALAGICTATLAKFTRCDFDDHPTFLDWENPLTYSDYLSQARET
jgi:hypothetical protein